MKLLNNDFLISIAVRTNIQTQNLPIAYGNLYPLFKMNIYIAAFNIPELLAR